MTVSDLSQQYDSLQVSTSRIASRRQWEDKTKATAVATQSTAYNSSEELIQRVGWWAREPRKGVFVLGFFTEHDTDGTEKPPNDLVV